MPSIAAAVVACSFLAVHLSAAAAAELAPDVWSEQEGRQAITNLLNGGRREDTRGRPRHTNGKNRRRPMMDGVSCISSAMSATADSNTTAPITQFISFDKGRLEVNRVRVPRDFSPRGDKTGITVSLAVAHRPGPMTLLRLECGPQPQPMDESVAVPVSFFLTHRQDQPQLQQEHQQGVRKRCKVRVACVSATERVRATMPPPDIAPF
ncbi:unnamed protein product [Vitrella brassicaformis CCMP3155]|uniref:ZP domain-containing protein n=2 Tax=Vitrella brassicaformis TaxID=1169539 RepID=A0A0G4G6D9_VITBC|nr:unnamed protein product [Vitrella brassicaformis CCMP3155]|eukprot:CEM23910.1 unnamed protein product [Vitrella brassicaformis CCMP3155]